MAEVSYPSTLPQPRAKTDTAADRRQTSDSQAPRESRAIERERRRDEVIEFPPMTRAQASVFWAWFDDDLLDGGAWFTATYPTAQGRVAVTRKFLERPRATFVPSASGGYWLISATCETRDGPPPVRADGPAFLETFTGSGSLIGHQPDFGSSGADWASLYGTETYPRLLGDGTAGPLAEEVFAAAAVTLGAAVPLTAPWRVTLTADVTAQASPQAVANQAYLLLVSESDDQIEVRIQNESGGTTGVIVNTFISPSSPTTDTFSASISGPHVVTLDVSDTAILVKLDGGTLGTVTLDTTAFAALAYVEIELSAANNDVAIDEIRVDSPAV